MKRIFTHILMAVGITVPFVTNVAAQGHRMTIDIPFAFEASHRTLPAGQYSVSELKTGAPVFIMQDRDGHSTVVPLQVNETGAPENPSITFACYGNERVLAKITPPGSPLAFGLSKESIEKNLTHKVGMTPMVLIKLKAR